jgi:integrase
LCLAALAYLGPRRRAASNLRRRDVDLDRGAIRFREKGGKIITKPIPEEFAGLLRTAIRAGAIGASPESYVIPMPRGQRREDDRDDRITWRTIKNLGERARVEVHREVDQFGGIFRCRVCRTEVDPMLIDRPAEGDIRIVT